MHAIVTCPLFMFDLLFADWRHLTIAAGVYIGLCIYECVYRRMWKCDEIDRELLPSLKVIINLCSKGLLRRMCFRCLHCQNSLRGNSYGASTP